MAHTSVTKAHSANTGVANTYSYSGSFDVFKGSEVVVTLDAVTLTFTASTINESASPREYTVDTTAKTVHIGGADLSSGTIIIRPVTDMGAPTAQAIYSAGSSITASDLNNNQTQLLRKAMEYDEQKLSSTGGTMTGDLELGENVKIIFEGSSADAHETTLTVANPDGDRTITLPNVTGTVVTTGDTGTVATGMIAADAVDGTKIADDAINSEHYTDGSIDTVHIADSQITTAKLANDSVTSAKILDGEVVNADLNAAAAIAHSKLAAIPDGQILVGNGATVPTAVAVSGDITISNTGAVTIANDAVEIGMIGCEQTTISDSDSHIPTSGAVVDYVAAQLAPIGGFEVIADEDNFPTSQPASGVVISIADAGGITFNGSGVATNARTAGNGSDNVTINNAPSTLYGETLVAGVGLQVSSTGSSNTYNYHKILAKEGDVKQLSDDINDFNERYRVASSAPGSNNDAGDLYYDTNTDKMYVRNSANNAWGEVTSTGEFKFLYLCPNGGSGAPTINGSIATYDLREGSNSGTGASVTTAAQLIVSINGVVQKPNTGTSAPAEGFAMVDANTIIFGSNLPTGAEVFVIQVGSAVSIPTPGDNTVTSAKIVDGAIMNADINASADIAGSKIADDSIAEVKLDIHNAPSGTDKYLKYTSNGMEWAVDNNTNLLAGGTATGHINLDNDKELRLMEADSNGSAYVGLKGATDKGSESSYTLSLPAAAPTAGKALVANASTPTNLEWGTAGGASGGGTDQIFYENEPTVTTNYTIAGNASTAMNAMSAGPITINNGVTITIGANQTWTIV